MRPVGAVDAAMKRRGFFAAGLAGLALIFGVAAASAQDQPAAGQGEAASGGMLQYPLKEAPLLNWSFAGIFGRYDPAQLQRGFQVYREVCSACHGLKYVAFRTLAGPGGIGFSTEEVQALAASYDIADGPDENGDMFTRPGRPSDYFPSPFPNVQAAAAANGGAAPPDLSLMAKARSEERGPVWTVLDFFTQYEQGGPDYIHAILTGFGQDPPPGITIPPGGHYNPYFLNGPSIAMPPPLSDGAVTYSDGSPQTVDQYATDVATFLMWAAEPHLIERKRLGFQVIIFLAVFAALMYMTKRRVWAPIAH